MSPAVVHQDVSDTYDIGTISTKPPLASVLIRLFCGSDCGSGTCRIDAVYMSLAMGLPYQAH